MKRSKWKSWKWLALQCCLITFEINKKKHKSPQKTSQQSEKLLTYEGND